MGRLVLYIATSLDGYIARPDGSIDWLTRFEASGTDFGFHEFYSSVDALLMGRKTYDQVSGFGAWPHADRPCYVLTHSIRTFEHAERRGGNLRAVLGELHQRHRTIWLVGGADVAGQAISQRYLQELIVTIVPVMLGSGMPLAGGHGSYVELRQVETRSYAHGVTQLRYRLQDDS